MFVHLQADYRVGIGKYLITSLLNRDHLGLDHMESHDIAGGFQEITPYAYQ